MMPMPPIPTGHFEGCLLGLALGDALGAPREGGPLERLLWALIGKTAQGQMRWTDDTQMSLDVADSLLACGGLDANDMAQRFARSYRFSRGYGPGAARLLKRIRRGQDWQSASLSIYPGGSFGNGGAMRAPVFALFHAAQPQALPSAVQLGTRITHAHPLGQEGALLVAQATRLALSGSSGVQLLEGLRENATQAPFVQALELALRWLRGDTPQEGPQEAPPDARQVRRQLGNGIEATRSCVTAIYLAARFLAQPFEAMLGFIARCGGDVDTIGAMAGAIWGAARGKLSLSAEALARLEQAPRIAATARALHGAAFGAAP